MTRSELIEELTTKLAVQHPKLTAKDIELATFTILEGLANTLAGRGRVEIRGFGNFVINKRPPRTGRNPRTGEAVMVPEKALPYFKAGKELRERVDYE